MLLSIVIINWNTRDILRDCLKSVYEQTKDIAFEVIVVDNASEDGSQEMARQQFPEVILIANQQNRGFAAANNQGMKIAKGKYILLLNSDTIVLDNAIGRTVEFAEKCPKAAVVGCKILNPDHTLQPSCSMFPSILNQILFVTGLYRLLASNSFFGREKMTWWQYDDSRQVDVLSGCFMLVRNEAVKQVGMFDESFFMYSEEVDWCWRFKKKDWKISFCPGASIIHLGGSSAAKLGPERAKIKDTSSIMFYYKHFSKPKIYTAVFLMAVFYTTRLIVAFFALLLKKSEKNKLTLANHWTGLKNIFASYKSARKKLSSKQ